MDKAQKKQSYLVLLQWGGNLTGALAKSSTAARIFLAFCFFTLLWSHTITGVGGKMCVIPRTVKTICKDYHVENESKSERVRAGMEFWRKYL